MSQILKILYLLVEYEYDAVLSTPSIFAYGFFSCPNSLFLSAVFSGRVEREWIKRGQKVEGKGGCECGKIEKVRWEG